MDGLLLIHAFPLDARMWEPQVAAFDASGIAVVTPHLPGFGGTEGAGEIMSMRSAAERCLNALDAAGVDRAVVCGLSMGGYVAFEIWRLARQRVAGLVLANTRAEADSAEGAESRRTLAERLLGEGNVLVESPPPLLSSDASGELRKRVRELIAAQPAASIAAALLGMAQRPDSSGDLPGIGVPTLVVTSEADTLIPPEITATIAERVPSARLQTIPKAGHLSNLEAPGEFNGLVEEHLERCSLAAS